MITPGPLSKKTTVLPLGLPEKTSATARAIGDQGEAVRSECDSVTRPWPLPLPPKPAL